MTTPRTAGICFSHSVLIIHEPMMCNGGKAFNILKRKDHSLVDMDYFNEIGKEVDGISPSHWRL